MEKIQPTKSGIHLIAIFEAFKGLLGIIAGLGLLSLVHKDLQAFAGNLIEHLRFDPSGDLAHKFIETAGKIDESNITLISILCFIYAIVRFTEAYGLWFLKVWAEWFAIISGAIYIPVETYELVHKPTFTRAAILIFNIAIVIYLYSFRKDQKHEEEISPESQIRANKTESKTVS